MKTERVAKPREKDLLGLFARVGDALLSPLQDQLRTSGLSVADWRLLKSLARTRVVDAAGRALPAKAPLARAMMRMERAGLVRPRDASSDRALRGARLTKRGRSIARRLALLEARQERIVTSALGKTASRELKVVLARFIRAIEERETKTLLRPGRQPRQR